MGDLVKEAGRIKERLTTASIIVIGMIMILLSSAFDLVRAFQ